jgi:hypothetical protein
VRTWEQPYSVKRLLRMIVGWTFHSDYDDLEENGESSLFLAHRRINQILRTRRDGRSADYDPIDDEEQALFYVADIALIVARWRELEHLEDQLKLATGPACIEQRFNRKTGKLEDLGPADAYGD